ncbi:MAG: hypothetical protein MJ078_03830 [Clostridia bacterium]|nr:hypothetical protein [Clostridia bacterium]
MQQKGYKKYVYEGSVTDGFYRALSCFWHGTTLAVSEAQARNNLSYQYKKAMGMPVNRKVFLCGTVRVE